MLNIYIIIITALFFAFCTATLVYQAIDSAYFRSRIAVPHEFVEGMMTGASYPLMWTLYGLIGVQFFSFIVIEPADNRICAIRLFCFALSVILFAVLKSLTPSLLAYWFGKTALWNGKGINGKISFSDIYWVKVHNKKENRHINPQQVYKITFLVKDKAFLLLPKKYTCKMTAQQISVLTPFVDFKECKKPRPSAKAVIYSLFAPILLVAIMACCFMLVFSVAAPTVLLPITSLLLIALFAIKQFAYSEKAD